MRNDKEQITNIINNINNKKINKFLIEAILADDKLYECFRREYIDFFPTLTKEDYQNKIKDSIRKCCNNKGFIDYSLTHQYTYEMYGFINEAEKLIERKNYDLASEIITIILNSIPNTDIDDSDGSTGEVAESCIEILQIILEKCLEQNENKILKKILDYIINEARTEYIANYGIETYDLFAFYIENKLYLSEIEEALIIILNEKKDKTYFWNKKRYIKFLKMTSSITNNEDVKKFIQEYSN